MRVDRKTVLLFLMTISLLTPSCAPVAAATSGPVAAAETFDIPNATITYYDITGSTASELRAQLDARGPVGYDGYKGDATTDWFIHWNWPGYGSAACDLSAATISFDINVILPRWVPPGSASPDLIDKWSEYVRLLALHEKGHVDYVLENSQSIMDAIKGSTCGAADAAGTRILEQFRGHDIDYDAETRHGATQGAVFP